MGRVRYKKADTIQPRRGRGGGAAKGAELEGRRTQRRYCSNAMAGVVGVRRCRCSCGAVRRRQGGRVRN